MKPIRTLIADDEPLAREGLELLARADPELEVIGLCPDGRTAAQAIREIVRRCLYDLWIDFGEIKIRAYLGET